MTTESTNAAINPRFSLRVLRQDEVLERWPDIAGLLERAIDHCHGDLELSDIKMLVNDGRAFILLLEEDGRARLAAACEVLEYPRRKVLNVIAVGGAKLDVMLGFWSQLQEIGRVLEVSAVRGSVRPSMQRYYRRIAPEASVAYNILERTI